MVLVLACHPFSSQRVVSSSEEPISILCYQHVLFVATVNQSIEIYYEVDQYFILVRRQDCGGDIKQLAYSAKGVYLAVLVKDVKSSIVKTFSNLQFDKAKVDVGSTKDEMSAILESSLNSLNFTPSCLNCCAATDKLIVGGNGRMVILQQGSDKSLEELMNIQLSIPDILIVNMYDLYIACATANQVVVLKVHSPSKRSDPEEEEYSTSLTENEEESVIFPLVQREKPFFKEKDINFEICGPVGCVPGLEVSINFKRHPQDDDVRVSYILYKFMSSVESSFHTMQLIPGHSQSSEYPSTDPLLTLHCLVSNDKEGYLYQLHPYVQMQSRYPYISPCMSVKMGQDFLHAATDHGVATYTQRISAAVVSELEKVDNINNVCPSPCQEICLISMQPFLGLKCLEAFEDKVFLLSKVKDVGSQSSAWSIYALRGAECLSVHEDIMEFVRQSGKMNPEIYLQGLVEAHLLVRSENIRKSHQDSQKSAVLAALENSCKLLGEFHARNSSSDWHLALPYFMQTSLTIEEVFSLCQQDKNESSADKVPSLSPGLLHYLEHTLFQMKTCISISQTCMSRILDCFLHHCPSLCSKLILCPQLESKVDLQKASQTLQALRKQVIHGNTYQWQVIDSVAAMNVHLRNGEMDQATAVLNLFYEDELVKLCCDQPELVLTNDGTELTHMAQLLCKHLPVVAVLIFQAVVEQEKFSFPVICNALQSNPNVKLHFLESLCESKLHPFHSEAVESLVFVYLERLCQKNDISRQTLTSLKRSTQRLAKQHIKGRYQWLDLLPPFNGIISLDCLRMREKAQSAPRHGKWGFSKSTQSTSKGVEQSDTSKSECSCYICWEDLIKLQQVLSCECLPIETLQSLSSENTKLVESHGRASIELLCLLNTNLKMALQTVVINYPPILKDFAISAIRGHDLNLWSSMVAQVQEQLKATEGDEKKIYRKCLQDILNHLTKVLSPNDFKSCLPPKMDSDEIGPFVQRNLKEESVKDLQKEIVECLAVLAK